MHRGCRVKIPDVKISRETIAGLEYCGGGYFRTPGPVGKKTFCIHAPELVAVLLRMLDEAEAKAKGAAI